MLRLTAAQAARLTKRHRPLSVQATWDARAEPGRIWISIPELPPSLNEWSRRHWTVRAEAVETLTDELAKLRMAFRIPKVELPRVQLVYYFATRRHRDPDNYAGKFLLDGLRHAGIIADDNAEVLQLPQPEFKVDWERPRTEILITKWRVESGANSCIE